MNKNIQSIIQWSKQPKKEMKEQSIQNDKTRFIKQIEQLVQMISESKTIRVDYLLKGFRLTSSNPQEFSKDLNNITSQIFGNTFKELEAKLHQFGFSINKKKTNDGGLAKITFRYTEQLFFGDKQDLIIDDNESLSSCQQSEQNPDDFPREQQMQQIIKNKEDRMRGFAKPNVILSKAHSDGLLGAATKKHNIDENSLEVQLQEQDLFSTPSAVNRKNTSNHRPIEQDCGQSLLERSQIHKQNYQRCSKLIDNTMLQILSAHRSRKIGDKADELLNKVIEIYDLLSDNIENVNSIVRDFQSHKGEKHENQMNSPGFKALDGLNENMK